MHGTGDVRTMLVCDTSQTHPNVQFLPLPEKNPASETLSRLSGSYDTSVFDRNLAGPNIVGMSFHGTDTYPELKR